MLKQASAVKNTTEILTKNLCRMRLLANTRIWLSATTLCMSIIQRGFILPIIRATIGSQSAGADHSLESDFFFQVVFVATAMSVVSGAFAERMRRSGHFLFFRRC